jgi:hypothetical protein
MRNYYEWRRYIHEYSMHPSRAAEHVPYDLRYEKLNGKTNRPYYSIRLNGEHRVWFQLVEEPYYAVVVLKIGEHNEKKISPLNDKELTDNIIKWNILDRM